jgi:Zn-dependent peptidase ImmA (M78 family)
LRQKIRRLRLVVGAKVYRTTTSIAIPEELPSVEEALKDLFEAITPLSVIAKKLGVSEESARAKIRRLGLEEVEQRKNACSSSSELIMPEELISIKEALKKLVASMTALETPGFKQEVTRLRSLIRATYMRH